MYLDKQFFQILTSIYFGTVIAKKDYEQITTLAICIAMYIQFYNWSFLRGGLEVTCWHLNNRHSGIGLPQQCAEPLDLALNSQNFGTVENWTRV